MKKELLLSLVFTFLLYNILSAQTTGTFIVTDNSNRMYSCDDTLITLEDIYNRCGIRDLNDPSDNVSQYRILQLNGSIITSTEITGSFKYSDYTQVYIEKTGTPFNGHNGISIFIGIITPPAFLFDKDTLYYTVEKEENINYVADFFEHLNLWSSGMDIRPLDERIFFTDQSIGTEAPIKNNPAWSLVGKGNYRLRIEISACRANDIIEDSIFVSIDESPCSNVRFKNLPPVCRDEIIDITPYVYVDDHVATPVELSNMTFWDKSDIFNQPSAPTFDPTVTDFSSTWNSTDHYPQIEIRYQPNLTLGICQTYAYMPDFKVPSKFIVTDLVILHDNAGYSRNFTIDGVYYGFNNTFNKDVLNKLYLDYYDVFDGTTFKYFTDAAYTNEITGANLTPGNYFMIATNTDCNNDTSEFDIEIKNRDFDVIWQGAPNLGKGYYTFTAPVYSGATYTWFVWGGNIVNGLNTNQITVYYSENNAPSTTVTCTIDLPARTTSGSSLYSGIYLNFDEENNIDPIDPEDFTTDNLNPVTELNELSVYPNPTEGTFSVSGEGIYELKIYNAIGQIIYEDLAYNTNSSVHLKNKGIYMVHLNQNGRRQILRLLVD